MQLKAAGARLRRILPHLQKRYPWIPREGDLPQLEELVLTLLAYDGSWRQGMRALSAFQEQYVDWNEVRVSSPDEMAEIPEIGKLPKVKDKAEALVKVLDRVFLDHNRIALAFGPDQGEDAKKYLTGIRELASIARGVFLYRCFKYPKAIVEAGVTRLLKRLDLLPQGANDEVAQRFLDKVTTGHSLAATWFALARHAEETCVTETPDCPHCAVQADCPVGQKLKAAKGKKPAAQ